MNILFDINHPAHVHFFRNPAKILSDNGANVMFTSRDKDVTLDLLDEYHIPHTPLSASSGGSVLALAKELLGRNLELLKVVRTFKPDAMASIGGTFIAHTGFLTNTPSAVFYDTENATLQNAITYPFASKVITPECYTGWVPKKRNIRYPGYHELSYLHESVFTPDKDIAVQNGLKEHSKNYFLRLVSWNANHDIGELGWSDELLLKIVAKLEAQGNVIISSEREIPNQLSNRLYKGDKSKIHHILGKCDQYFGESATMASEAVAMGVHASYIALTPRGYTTEQENEFQMVRNVHSLDWNRIEPIIEETLHLDKAKISSNFERLKSRCIDVPQFVAKTIESMAMK